MYVRSKVSESPVFAGGPGEGRGEEGTKQPLPLWAVLRRPKALILVILGPARRSASRSPWQPSRRPTPCSSAGSTGPRCCSRYSAASFLGIFAVLYAGRLSDRFGRKPVVITGIVLFTGLPGPFFAWWGSGNIWLVLLGFFLACSSTALIYGPLAAFISEQFGTGSRYTGASLGYQLATLLGAGFTPALLATLFKDSGGSITPVVLFLIGMGVVSAVAVLLIREGRNDDLRTVEQ